MTLQSQNIASSIFDIPKDLASKAVNTFLYNKEKGQFLPMSPLTRLGNLPKTKEGFADPTSPEAGSLLMDVGFEATTGLRSVAKGAKLITPDKFDKALDLVKKPINATLDEVMNAQKIVDQTFKQQLTPQELLQLRKQPAKILELVQKRLRAYSQPIKSLEQSDFIRFANDKNKITNEFRGGTWFTNKKGAGVIEDAMDPRNVRKVAIGGNKIFSLKNAPKKPLVVENAILEDGSFSVINSGYENYLPTKYRNAADNLYTSIHKDLGEISADEVDRLIMNALHDANIPVEQARKIITLFSKNKFDAAMDAIISKGLKAEGYDSLILRDRGAEHILMFNPKVSSKIQ